MEVVGWPSSATAHKHVQLIINVWFHLASFLSKCLKKVGDIVFPRVLLYFLGSVVRYCEH
jgi:hypothetical protein